MNLAKKLLIAATLTLAGGVASAATVAMTDNSGTAGTLISVGDIASTPNPVGFSPPSDTWYFNVASASTVTVFLTAYEGVTSLVGNLFASDDTNIGTVNTGGSLTLTLGAGLYHLVVDGSDGTPDYVAFAKLGQPVPLPAAAWLLVSGLAGLGAMARRRKGEAA